MKTEEPFVVAESDLKAGHLVAVVIHSALIAGLACYVAVVEVVRRGSQQHGAFESIDTVTYACFAVAIALPFAIKVVRGMFLARKPGDDPRALVVRLQRAAGVTAALCEIPAVLGLAVFVMGGAQVDFYLLLAISLGMFVVYFPRLSEWKERMTGRRQ